MNNSSIYKENDMIQEEDLQIQGELLSFEGENYFKISNSNQMRPFFISLVSNSDHWMFISSNGGLSAGRKNSEYSLFPYYTDDKITESFDITGSKTIVKTLKDGNWLLWEPFSDRITGAYSIKRNLYKNIWGNKIVFEEINETLGIKFTYQWASSDRFGFVKKSTITNLTADEKLVKVLDGIQNILPYGVSEALQGIRSNLVDAYKKSEIEKEYGIGIYALSAKIVDKAEPSEALKANMAWSFNTSNPIYLASSVQLDKFRTTGSVAEEIDVKAEKGAYFTSQVFELKENATSHWYTVAEVNVTVSDIKKVANIIKNTNDLESEVLADIEAGTKNLIELVGASDGMQLGDSPLRNARHFSNTLFNIMRGGIFDNNYQIEKDDFLKYIKKANSSVYKNQNSLLQGLPEFFDVNTLKELAPNNDTDFKRLCVEYLPLKFSRRHGDPSRPWNKFSINTRSEVNGSKILDYEGNWRDIFQNWEALAHSYPAFIEGMIHKFLNASTFDGYNPYRVTKDGFDWEVIEPDDPWSYIGYWGDHQIIYLLKFLEFIENYYPGQLSSSFADNLFVYANVPYKIKSYNDIVANPKDTIDFDHPLDQQINKDKAVLGADGALIKNQQNQIHKVNMMEKLLATMLAKVSNFIPEGGIWLNTQRPEWNDANNALVGNGVSMVTLYYLRRFTTFFKNAVANSTHDTFLISKEFQGFFDSVVTTLNTNKSILSGTITDEQRKTVLDGLGIAGSDYRVNIYENGFTGEKDTISKDAIVEFCDTLLAYLDQTISKNKRDDNMYHAYNLMTVENDKEVSISYLSEMLEGQVAALSSGYLSPTEALELLDGLKASALFRPDQYSYILYPDKQLPRFLDKNNISKEAVESSELLQTLIKDGDLSIVEVDVNGECHFNGNFNNAEVLKVALSNLDDKYSDLVEKDRKKLLAIYEDIFDHKSFTGRSGTFFGYEGLGSIYWHMVSKLLLAVQENCWLAVHTNQTPEVIGRLLEHYYEINAGIGVEKSPELYGAFPTDAYSHTPATKGAQQPGMTGQVKEDILSRIGELGILVSEGELRFNPRLLRRDEFLTSEQNFNYIDVNGENQSIALGVNSLCFTFCQVPVVYRLGTSESIEVKFNGSTSESIDGLSVNSTLSNEIFNRSGKIEKLEVTILEENVA
ncbi:MAG: hypothetical protein ACON4X_07530 [Polaribacter sp.]